jgi:hypothetical protein
LANNNLGALVLPKGWEEDTEGVFDGPNDEEQDHPLPGSIPTGIIAIANAISNMRALLSANLLGNSISAEQAQQSFTKSWLLPSSPSARKYPDMPIDVTKYPYLISHPIIGRCCP